MQEELSRQLNDCQQQNILLKEKISLLEKQFKEQLVRSNEKSGVSGQQQSSQNENQRDSVNLDSYEQDSLFINSRPQSSNYIQHIKQLNNFSNELTIQKYENLENRLQQMQFLISDWQREKHELQIEIVSLKALNQDYSVEVETHQKNAQLYQTLFEGTQQQYQETMHGAEQRLDTIVQEMRSKFEEEKKSEFSELNSIIQELNQEIKNLRAGEGAASLEIIQEESKELELLRNENSQYLDINRQLHEQLQLQNQETYELNNKTSIQLKEMKNSILQIQQQKEEIYNKLKIRENEINQLLNEQFQQKQVEEQNIKQIANLDFTSLNNLTKDQLIDEVHQIQKYYIHQKNTALAMQRTIANYSEYLKSKYESFYAQNREWEEYAENLAKLDQQLKQINRENENLEKQIQYSHSELEDLKKKYDSEVAFQNKYLNEVINMAKQIEILTTFNYVIQKEIVQILNGDKQRLSQFYEKIDQLKQTWRESNEEFSKFTDVQDLYEMNKQLLRKLKQSPQSSF